MNEKPKSMPLEIVTTSNDNYIVGLAVTLVSILISTKKNQIRFSVLDAGISNDNKFKLKKLLSEIESSVIINFIHVDDSCFKGALPDYGGGYSTYYRLLIGSHIESEKAIYVDADFLCRKDFSELWHLPISDSIMIATQDLDTPNGMPATLAHDCPFTDDEHVLDKPYFNAGFFLINVTEWNRRNYQEKSLKLVSEYKNQLKAWDQTVLNFILMDQISPLEQSWCTSCSWVPVKRRTNTHYISRKKPWNSFSFNPQYRNWRRLHSLHVKKYFPISLSTLQKVHGILTDVRDIVVSRSQLLLSCYLAILKWRGRSEKIAMYYKSYITRLSRFSINDLLSASYSDF